MSLRVTPLVIALALALGSDAWAHGYLVQPPARTDDHYQFDPLPCAEYPDPGPITATYDQGQSVTFSLNITVTHGAGDYFRFQLCPMSEISEQCFLDGEFASFLNAGQRGIQHFEVELPEDLTCEHCVLRWQWDYGFLSCADIAIVPEPGTSSLSSAALLSLLALRRRQTGRQ